MGYNRGISKVSIIEHRRKIKILMVIILKKCIHFCDGENYLISEKLECIKKQAQRKEEIKQFNEERAKIHSQMNDSTNICDATLTIVTRRNSQDDIAEGIDLKVYIRVLLEFRVFLKLQKITSNV